MKYKIYPTLHSEIRKGTIWTFYKTESNLIKIKNLENKKCIIVAYRFIEGNFEKLYKKDLKPNFENEAIVIDKYYRDKLSVKKNAIVNLEIKPIRKYCFICRLRYLSSHPDEVVKITFWFAFLTFLFSFITYFLPLSKLCDCITKIISQFN